MIIFWIFMCMPFSLVVLATWGAISDGRAIKKREQIRRIDKMERECFPEWFTKHGFEPWSELRKVWAK